LSQTPRDELNARGPLWLWVLVSVAIIGTMSAIRLYVYPDEIVPLSYALPLLVFLYCRRLGLLWMVAGAFVGLVATKMIMIDDSALSLRDRVTFGLMQIVTILVCAAAFHRVVFLTARLKAANHELEVSNAELETSNEELAAREEEITRQNEELQAQTEELEQQMEELNTQAEELHSLNDLLAARDRTLTDLLESPASVAGESDVRSSMGVAIGRLLGARVAAAAHLEPRGELFLSHDLFGSVSQPAGRTFEQTLASIATSRRSAAFVPDLAERPDLSVTLSDARSLRSTLAAPIRSGDHVHGAIEFYSLAPGPWTEDELRIGQWLADQYGRLLHAARMRDDLDRQRQLLRTVADNTWGALIVSDADGHVTYMNPVAQRLLGRGIDAAASIHLHDLLHGSDHDGKSCPLLARNDSAPRVQEDTIRSAAGEGIPARCLISPVLDDGSVVMTVVELHDVREQRRMEVEREQLLQSERAARIELERVSRAKDEFVATLSHELRTPLNAILGWAALLTQGRVTEPQEVAKGLEVIERNSRHQAQLISDLLDISRITAGKVRLQLRDVAIKEAIEAAVASARPAAEAKGLELTVECAATDTVVYGDPERLQQVLWNLLANAIKFTPRGGSVRVAVQTVHASVQIRISDNGQGIEPELLDGLFERYRQGDASTTRLHAGLGLGLAIARHLIELHGGTIAASSEGAGRGATFTILLPVCSRTLPSAAAADSPSPSGSTTAKELAGLNVLAVDDDADARDLIKRLLEEHGASVQTADSAAAALQAIVQHTVDLLISDIGMPGMDGYSLIRTVRAQPHERIRMIPAIALTAFARGEDRSRAIQAGFQAHASKPVDPAELTSLIVRLIGRTGTRRNEMS
jgi:PAS domain S-box-containing protein